MLNTMMENEFFSEVMAADLGICDHDHKEKNKSNTFFLFSVIIFNMKLLPKVKANTTIIKESYKVTSRLNCT